MTTGSTYTPGKSGNLGDYEYNELLAQFQDSFRNTVQESPLFTVSTDGLWYVYLESFSNLEVRQHHNCRYCRQFIERFGGLVTVGARGELRSAMWQLRSGSLYSMVAFANLRKEVEARRIRGVFASDQLTWGHPTTGVWHHLSVLPTLKHVVSAGVTVESFAGAKSQDFGLLKQALALYPLAIVQHARSLLSMGTLFRGEKLIGPAKWLEELHLRLTTAQSGTHRDHLIWHAVAMAPEGWCHVGNSMLGSLLEDLAGGLSLEEVKRRFDEKMSPDQYQRPSAAPSEGAIDVAERFFAQSGLADALKRRFARLDEVKLFWAPRSYIEQGRVKGVFSHLRPGPEGRELRSGGSSVMTWEKFQRTLLPAAVKIQVLIPDGYANFTTLLTAAVPGAPPILQWDTPESPNPFSYYVYLRGSPAHRWGLTAGRLVECVGLTRKPSEWWGENRYPHFGQGVIFLLEGAKDTPRHGSSLFPEFLRKELRVHRKVIEAHSEKDKLYGLEQSSASGLLFGSDKNHPITLYVTTGERMEYQVTLDRWD